MAKLITDGGRKAIKKIAQISQCARALHLMPSGEDFALRLIGDLRIIARRLNSISTRINEILDRYSNIPSEFLLEGFDVILKQLDNINDYAKFAIAETADVMTSTIKSTQELTESLGSALSATSSAVLQIGGGLVYGGAAMSANLKLAMTGNGRRAMTNDVVQDVVDGKVAVSEMETEIANRISNESDGMTDAADAIRDWTVSVSTGSVELFDGVADRINNGNSEHKGLDGALAGINTAKEWSDGVVDSSVGVLIEKVENAKKQVEDKIERVREIFNNLTKNFDEAFGFVNGKNFAEETFRNASNTAIEKMDTPVFDALGEVTGEIADFIKNFNVGKVITAMGGIVVGAGAATLAMDLLPHIDVDRMLIDIIGGVDTYRVDKMMELYRNKYNESGPDLLEVPDVPWLLSKDDLEKYNADGYNSYLEKFTEINDNTRCEILEKMQNSTGVLNRMAISRENREKMKEDKNKKDSALKAMRKVRRDAIKAKQIEKYKGFLSIELEYLKRECNNMKFSIKREWDLMMDQYKTAIKEIKRFFTEDGCGGNDAIDRCCDRINDDATQIVELCKSLGVELTSAINMIPTPYAIGTCVDMPVHKLLAFFKDIKIIITFLKNLIRLGIDIISQLTILAKIICNGLQSLADIMNTLKNLIGVDRILNMINYLVELFRPKMIDAKILLENSISPVYYNETDDYEARVAALESLIDADYENDDVKVTVDKFLYTEDVYHKKYDKNGIGGEVKAGELEDILEQLEEKGEREIVAYRSPILNAEGDDFAGWIFFHPDAYSSMDTQWKPWIKRVKNKLIKRASKKNKLGLGKLRGGIAQLKRNKTFGKTVNGEYQRWTKNGYDAYYWYTKWTNDPTDCLPDMDNKGEDVVSPVTTTANGSLVELSDGRRVFVEGEVVKSGDYVNVNGVKYRVK